MTHVPPDPNKITDAGYSGQFDWMNEAIYEPAPLHHRRANWSGYAIIVLIILAIATGVLFALAPV